MAACLNPFDACTETRQWRFLILNGDDDRKTDEIEYFSSLRARPP
jgi:hypothetical protein